MVEVHGVVAPGFEPVRDAFAANFAGGGEVGACFSATLKGETVVDIWAGHADAAATQPWQQDTIINVYSTTKTMCALTALLLADRGELDFAKPVAHYWPEFAANGKAEVTVAHLMSHSAGLSGFKEAVTTEDLYDWDKICGLLAAQEPYWAPGDGTGLSRADPGLSRRRSRSPHRRRQPRHAVPHRDRRAARRRFPHRPARKRGRPVRRADPAATGQGHRRGQPVVAYPETWPTRPAVNPLETRTRAWRAAEIPAANGHGNARSVALVQTLMANGGVANGKRILSEAGVRRALESQVQGMDLVLAIPVHFGLGYGLPGGMMPFPNPNSVFWGGYGGSLVIADMDARLCMAYVMNRMAPTTTGDLRAASIAAACWQVVLAG